MAGFCAGLIEPACGWACASACAIGSSRSKRCLGRSASRPGPGPPGAAGVGRAEGPAAGPGRLPSSLGLTVLVDATAAEIDVLLSWGDYAPEPPLPPAVLEEDGPPLDTKFRDLRWRRVPG